MRDGHGSAPSVMQKSYWAGAIDTSQAANESYFQKQRRGRVFLCFVFLQLNSVPSLSIYLSMRINIDKNLIK